MALIEPVIRNQDVQESHISRKARLIIAVIIAIHAAMAAPRPDTLSVCDLIPDDPTKHNGEIVSVRGSLEATQEGTWLAGECNNRLVTKGVTWGNILWVYVDSSDEKIDRSWRLISDKLSRLHAHIDTDLIWVTIVGRLETRKSMDDAIYQMPYGPAKVGFGHLGAAPAEIDVISVQEVTVERRSNAKKTPKK